MTARGALSRLKKRGRREGVRPRAVRIKEGGNDGKHCLPVISIGYNEQAEQDN